MRPLDGFSRTGVVRLTGVLVAAVAVAACCVGVSPAAAGGGWTAPTNIDSVRYSTLRSVSCPSATFCVAVDDLGHAWTYNGTSWSTPTHIDSGDYVGQSVSCSSATFCAELSYDGPGVSYALTYNGKSWTAPTNIDGIDGVDYEAGGIDSVSCPSATFCLAVGTGEGEYVFTHYALTYNGTSWSAPTQIDNSDSGGYFNSVSCPSATFCTAVSDTGYALTYNGTSWSGGTNIAPNPPGTCSMSCAYEGLTSVSCSSATFCIAVDYDGDALTYNGTSWSTPTHIGGDEDGVSCPSATFCVAVDPNDALTYNGTSWSTPILIGANEGGLTSVSCASATFCAAVGGRDALTYTTATASASVKIEKFKVTTSGLVVTIKTSRAGAVTITGPGLKKTTRTVAAGTRVMTVALTKAGKAERGGRKKIKLSVSLKTGTKTVSGSKVITL